MENKFRASAEQEERGRGSAGQSKREGNFRAKEHAEEVRASAEPAQGKREKSFSSE